MFPRKETDKLARVFVFLLFYRGKELPYSLPMETVVISLLFRENRYEWIFHQPIGLA